jgi:hypothetical protein
MTMPDTSALALLDLSQSSIKVVRPSTTNNSVSSSRSPSTATTTTKNTPTTGSSRLSATPTTSITGGLFAGASYPSISHSSSNASIGRSGSSGSRSTHVPSSAVPTSSATPTTSSGWTTYNVNTSVTNSNETLRQLMNNGDLTRSTRSSGAAGISTTNRSGHIRQSSTSSSSATATPAPTSALDTASEEATITKEEAARRALENMNRKQSNQERELDDLESRYRLRALSKVTPRLHKYNNDIFQATDEYV